MSEKSPMVRKDRSGFLEHLISATVFTLLATLMCYSICTVYRVMTMEPPWKAETGLALLVGAVVGSLLAGRYPKAMALVGTGGVAAGMAVVLDSRGVAVAWTVGVLLVFLPMTLLKFQFQGFWSVRGPAWSWWPCGWIQVVLGGLWILMVFVPMLSGAMLTPRSELVRMALQGNFKNAFSEASENPDDFVMVFKPFDLGSTRHRLEGGYFVYRHPLTLEELESRGSRVLLVSSRAFDMRRKWEFTPDMRFPAIRWRERLNGCNLTPDEFGQIDFEDYWYISFTGGGAEPASDS
jgi:hypothetical protein